MLQGIAVADVQPQVMQSALRSGIQPQAVMLVAAAQENRPVHAVRDLHADNLLVERRRALHVRNGYPDMP